jgi:hypothetical protein
MGPFGQSPTVFRSARHDSTASYRYMGALSSKRKSGRAARQGAFELPSEVFVRSKSVMAALLPFLSR